MADEHFHALGQVAQPSTQPQSPWQRLTTWFWERIAKILNNNEVPLAAHSPFGRSLERLRKTFVGVFVLSIGTNLLMLTAPMYMLQLYDRVLSSRSMDTLLALSLLVAGLFAVLALLEVARSRSMIRVAQAVDKELTPGLFKSLSRATGPKDTKGSNQLLNDMDSVRGMLTSPALFAFFDAPWSPIYILVIFIMHPLLGSIALVGAIFMFSMALTVNRLSQPPMQRAIPFRNIASRMTNMVQKNQSVVQSMGMGESLTKRWQQSHEAATGWQGRASDLIGSMSGVSKTVRLSLQSAILGAGAYLVLQNPPAVTPGVMIAASIIMGRALAPLDQAIGAWRNFISSRNAWQRLKQASTDIDFSRESKPIDISQSNLIVQNLSIAPPGVDDPLLTNFGINVPGGTLVGIVGPNASGKSTLGRVITGSWKPLEGKVRLGGVDVHQWPSEDRGRYVGYLPQESELFEGTVADNISRFREGVSHDAVVAAARATGVEQLILRLPNAYDTKLEPFGRNLSGAQQKAISLARALFGNPALLILDEPDTGFDVHSAVRLRKTLEGLKGGHATIILISHDPQLLAVTEHLVVFNGHGGVHSGPTRDKLKPAPSGQAG
ncbi:MAG: type I secretion system permease/ATPase [Gammaproteobacteria bacterium]|nr:type I secretion system permease/ATPase [Gammaproteobacteria bacterium]